MEIFPVIILLAMAGVLIYAVGEAIEVLRNIDSGQDIIIGALERINDSTERTFDEVEEMVSRFIDQEASVRNAGNAALCIEKYASSASLTLDRIEAAIQLHTGVKM